MEQLTQGNSRTKITIFTGLVLALMSIDFIFLMLVSNESKTIRLLKDELKILDQDRKIIAASDEIKDQYKNEVDVISNVFPNEERMPEFIETLESMIRSVSDEYNFKFNSLTPLPELDKLYVFMTVTMKTDMTRLQKFFLELERMPYMSHITAVSTKLPGGILGHGEVSLGIKVYVQNPFSTK